MRDARSHPSQPFRQERVYVRPPGPERWHQLRRDHEGAHQEHSVPPQGEADAVAVAALDCTKGLTQITLDGSGLNNVPSIEELQVHLIDSADRYIAYAHDANPELDWAPIVKISKNVSSSPLDNFKAHYYKVIVLIVRVSRRGGVRSVTSVEDIFRSVPIYCSTDF